ncbi:hypothetical protein FRB94_013973 [Tulasnella sp. JGI-2019a]|nr:hypothetical protein FRB94_013973 [Tulasnella sp. JGI-2019a]
MPDVFGEKRDFWLKYDTLADSKDKVMIGRLNQNLDVLLIFAGLFSAINTAFVVLTLTNLSAPPSYQTDALLTLVVMQVSSFTLTSNDLNPPFSPSHAAIRQNCTFFASLCTSILAAAGAVLAKQWLQSYERTGKTGSRRKQALLRTEKWMGAESWRLRSVVETLPTLLLISLALFFVALCDLLWSTSQPVALVVITFTAIGAVFYGFSVVAAASDAFCPYQTTVSTVIRGGGVGGGGGGVVLESRKPLLSKSSPWSTIFLRLPTCHPEISRLRTGQRTWKFLGGDSIWRRMMPTHSESGQEEPADMGPESIYAHSILWMLENVTEEEDVLACAENIPTLSQLSSVRIVSHSPLFSTLVRQFENALTDAIHNRATKGSDQTALVLGRAVVHVVIADPIRWAEVVARVLTAGEQDWTRLLGYRAGPRDLWALCCTASLVQCATTRDWIDGGLRNSIMNQTSCIMDEAAVVFLSSQPPSTIAFFSAMKLSPYGIPLHLVDPNIGNRTSLLSLLCLEVIDLAQGSQQPVDQRVKDVWLAQNGTNLIEYITKSIEAYDQLILKALIARTCFCTTRRFCNTIGPPNRRLLGVDVQTS